MHFLFFRLFIHIGHDWLIYTFLVSLSFTDKSINSINKKSHSNKLEAVTDLFCPVLRCTSEGKGKKHRAGTWYNQFFIGFWNVGTLKNECGLAVNYGGFKRTKLLKKPKICHQREVWRFHKMILIKNYNVKKKTLMNHTQ